MNITFIIVQYNGITAENNIVATEGYETKTGLPESEFVHLVRYIIFIMGSVICVMLFLFITSITLFVLTVGVLSRNGDLGNSNLMNR